MSVENSRLHGKEGESSLRTAPFKGGGNAIRPPVGFLPRVSCPGGKGSLTILKRDHRDESLRLPSGRKKEPSALYGTKKKHDPREGGQVMTKSKSVPAQEGTSHPISIQTEEYSY